MGIMSRTVAIASAFAVITLTAPAMASERDHDERGTRLQDEQGARVLFVARGGWDGNGPDMLGTVEEDRGTRLLYRRGRGGWDANGPDATGAEINLEGLVLEAIELPDAAQE
jgi:hypothetical protein